MISCIPILLHTITHYNGRGPESAVAKDDDVLQYEVHGKTISGIKPGVQIYYVAHAKSQKLTPTVANIKLVLPFHGSGFS